MSNPQTGRPQVLLFGLGGIGGTYACLLSLSGACDVHVVARSNYASVRRGVRFEAAVFGSHDVQFAGVWESCAAASSAGVVFDYVLCANKSLLSATPSLADHIRPVVAPSTSIVLLQNGVGGEAPLHAAFPNTTVISAVVWTGGKVLPDSEDGRAVISQFNKEGLTIGVDYREAQPGEAREGGKKEEDEKLQRLVGLLQKGGGTCTVTEDIQSERWVKVIWNCCWNSLTAASRLRTNPLFASSPGALPLCYALMHEVAAVARAKGLTVPDDTVETLIQRARGAEGLGLPSSMMFDCLGGKAMEVECILGTPMREGQRLDVPVPILTTLYTIVKALDYGNEHPELKVDGK